MPSPTVRDAREGRVALATTFSSSLTPARRAACVALCAGFSILQAMPVSAESAGGGAGLDPPPSALAHSGNLEGNHAANQSIVSASRLAPEAPREDLTASASVLLPADSPRAHDDLGALLLEVPGANVVRAGGIGSFASVSLRGANPDEVLVYVDGICLNQAVGGAVDLSTLPLGDVERVEVYRGSTPIGFGQSALGGVVSISTRTPVGTQASARLGAGSFRTTSFDLAAGGSAGRLRLYGGLHLLRAIGDFPDAPPAVAGGYQPPTRQNTDLEQGDAVARAILALPGRRELGAGFIGISRDQGLPAQNIFRSDARATSTRLLAHVDYQSRDDLGASSRLRAAVFASLTRERLEDREHQIVGVPTLTHDRTRSLGATATAEKALGDWGRITGLMEARGEDYLPVNELDATMPTGYPARRAQGTAGAELDVHSARLALDVIPSVRVEASRDLRTGRDPAFGENLPPAAPIDRALPVMRLGLLRPLGGGATARANLGRYARIPSFVELYGYNRGIIGSPELRPERGTNADVGLALDRRGPAGSLSASLTAFGAVVDDLIAWQTYGPQTRAENISRARIWGIESELRLRTRRLTTIMQATLTDARDRGDIASRFDRQLERRPRYRGYVRAEWRQPLPGPTGTLALCGYADLDGTAGNFATTGPYSAIPARLVGGAGVSLEHGPSGVRLSVSAYNLGDSRIEDFPNYPLPGRSVYLTLAWSSTKSTAEP